MLCEHLAQFNPHFLTEDIPHNPIEKKLSLNHSCCKKHLWKYIKQNHFDKVYEFIWTINDSIFNPYEINFVRSQSELQTKRGVVILRTVPPPFSGFPIDMDLCTPFGKIKFPFLNILNHKVKKKYQKFLMKRAGEWIENHANLYFNAVNYSEKKVKTQFLKINTRRDDAVLAKMWKILEKKRRLTKLRAPLAPSGLILANQIKNFKITFSWTNVYVYIVTPKYEIDSTSIKKIHNEEKNYFFSYEDFSKIINACGAEKERYVIDKAKIQLCSPFTCRITLYDGREAKTKLCLPEIYTLFQEMSPKILEKTVKDIRIDLSVWLGKLVNKNAQDILTPLFNSESKP